MSYNNGIELRLLVNGRPMREYSHKGSTFYESRHGTNYSIKLKNDNSFKVMAVLSVDGLDVITGKAADESNKGYILDAYSAIEVKGYRISDENSAAFVFTSKGKSYVQNVKGDARNSGVIGVRVFKEKYVAPTPAPTVIHKHHHHYHPQPQPYYVYPWNPYPTYPSYPNIWCSSSSGGAGMTVTTGGNVSNVTLGNNTVFGAGGQSATAYTVNASNQSDLGAQASYSCGNLTRGTARGTLKSVGSSNSFDAPISYKQFDTGTAWGKKLDDKVRREYFAKDSLLTEIVVYYASENALVDMGIDLNETPRMAEEDDKMPKAFNSKYCQPPKGWVG